MVKPTSRRSLFGAMYVVLPFSWTFMKPYLVNSLLFMGSSMFL
eukprot:COSAG03_NODE_6751_length_1010_cov_6.900110_1_plen_42_part_10